MDKETGNITTEESLVRTRLLERLLRTLVFLGMIAYLPSMYISVREGLYALAVINTIAYLSISFTVFHPRVGHQLRLTISVMMMLFVGITVLILAGNRGAGHIWLLFAISISSLFGRKLIIIIAITISNGALLAAYLLSRWGYLSHSQDFGSFIAISSNMLLVGISISMVSYLLLKELEGDLDKQEELSRFLHHRVKNNLQMTGSILSIYRNRGDNTEAEYDRAVEKQLEVLGGVNELILRNHERGETDLAELLGLMVRPNLDRVSGNALVNLSPELLTELAVAFTDLIILKGEESALLFTLGPGQIEVSGEERLSIDPEKTLFRREMIEVIDSRKLVINCGRPSGY